MYTVVLKKGEDKRIREGHPWVFANEVMKINGKDNQGSIAEVVDASGEFVAKGYINHASKILVRILTTDRDEPCDRAFFKARIQAANDQRLSMGYTDNYRMVHGESDRLPALIIDRYGDYLSVQFLSLGMDIRKQMIVDILVELMDPKGIYERSDSPIRQKEGLEEKKGLLYGEIPPKIYISENGILMGVDIENGQKTGYYLDQKDNRAALRNYVRNKSVLDCFCNVGGFSMCAAAFGASSVNALDISYFAVSEVRNNADINNFTDVVNAEVCNVFDKLREYRKQGVKYDVIILDPPAFTKSKDTLKEGLKGYRDINSLALKLLTKGGILVTCSCSQHVTVKLFLEMLEESSKYAGVPAQMLEFRTQGRDHPSLIGLDEALYLKVAILKVL